MSKKGRRFFSRK